MMSGLAWMDTRTHLQIPYVACCVRIHLEHISADNGRALLHSKSHVPTCLDSVTMSELMEPRRKLNPPPFPTERDKVIPDLNLPRTSWPAFTLLSLVKVQVSLGISATSSGFLGVNITALRG